MFNFTKKQATAFTASACILASVSASGATFPGGQPITASDLTASPVVLPAAPPAYNSNNPIDHDEFARFAWRQFIYLNSPAKQNGSNMPGKTPVVRGVVDDSRNFVTSGAADFYQDGKTSTENFSSNILVWESFAHRSELFPYKSFAKGDFQTLNPEYKFQDNVTVPSSKARFNNLDENSQIGQNKIFFPKNGNTPSKNPYDDYEILFQAKVNQVEYDYIKGFKGVAPGDLNLPPNASNNDETIEVKAAWRVLTNDLVQSGRYHTAEALYYLKDESTGEVEAHVGTFGLIGLHIIRKMKDYEAFVYSTFEHVDNMKKPDGTDSGLYFITLYDELTYVDQVTGKNTVSGTPHAIINNGVNRVQVPIPVAGKVVAKNGYDFIPGEYDLPGPHTAGPIKVVQPPTITKAVYDVNKEVKQAMQKSGQFSDSVWQYYELKGVQPLPVDEDSSVTPAKDQPLTQDFFLANNVIESSQPGIQLFKGGVQGPIPSGLFPNPRSGSGGVNIQNVPGLGADYNDVVMGGCMGCHGRSMYTVTQDGPDKGKNRSIFSFLISTATITGAGFEADELNESGEEFAAKAMHYLAK